MLSRLIPLLLLPSLSFAEPALTYGVSFPPGGQPSALQMEYCEGPCFAQVRYENQFLWGRALVRKFPLDLEGFAVKVIIVDGEGMAPEVFSVEPPPGYFAVPSELAVNEGDAGVIALYPMPMS